MAKFAFNQQIQYQSLQITDFLGVDFQNNPSEVALNRSPDALNVIASNNATIEKRPGYEILRTFAGGAKVNGIHVRTEYRAFTSETGMPAGETDVTYVHVGTQLWRKEDTYWSQVEQYTADLEQYPTHDVFSYVALSNLPSLFIETSGNLYIFCDGKVLSFYGYSWILSTQFRYPTFSNILDNYTMNFSYVPTTVIARAPTGGGTPYEAINALQQKRKNAFLGTAGTLIYQLDATALDAIVATDAYGLPGGGTVTAKILQSNGTYVTITEGAGLTVNRTTGVVTFSTAPGVTPLIGQDNVIIQFYKKVVGQGTPSFYIAGSTVFALFGMNGSDDYLFVGNSPYRKNYDYYGRTVDMYFAETAYTRFGGSQSAIMGYSRLGDYLVIHKTSEAEEKTIYLRSASLDTDNELIFPVKRGISGVGAVATRSFNTLRGDPLFLSDEGIMGLTSNAVTDVQSVQNRGYFINNRLLTEAGIADAVSCIYENKYMIFVNGKVYVGDSRRKFAEKDSFSESYQYEWYYWSGIDAKQVCVHKGTLYFGTSDGKLCRMRKKGETNAHLDNATAVTGYWSTPVLFMGDMTVKKSLKNIWLKMQQYLTSEVKVYYRCRSTVTLAKDKEFDTASFAGLDYNRLTFETNKDAEVIVTNRVERQFLSIQFKFLNDANENFGLIEVIAKYRVNSAYKGS